jgi:VanZ family protein
VLYAISDEIHQLFRARTGQVKDVFIDTIGILIAILFIKIIKKIKTKHA